MDPDTSPSLPSPQCTSAPWRGQRVLDLVIVVVAAVVVVPVCAVCALAVAVSSRGPVLFRQQRVGRGGEPFEVRKFRTMVHGDNPLLPDADRITPVGRVLRRLSLDELPQLLNVLRGEMSIVGPRPTLAYQVARYDDRQLQRLCVRPGLTGLAQVRGRNALSWAERIDLDLEYVARCSLWMDLRVLLATPVALLSGSGVEGHDPEDPLARPE